MALSNRWTADKIWREAVVDIGESAWGVVLPFERFNLINRAIETVVGQFYDLLAQSYMTEVTPVLSTTGKYYSSGASYDADTDTLTATMNESFASTDVGKVIVFREAANVYLGTILSYTSTTAVVVTGDNLPSADIATVDDVIVVGTTPTSDQISLEDLSIMRAGQQFRLELESTVTEAIVYRTTEELRTFRTTAAQNLKTIAVAFSGNILYLKKGTSLSSYGTLTIRYPKLPDQVSAAGDYLDVPDGITMQLVTMYLRTLIYSRLKIVKEDNKGEIENMIRRMYNTFGAEVSAETVEEKVMMLK